MSINAAIGLAMCGVLTLACSRKPQTEPAGAGLLGSSASAAQVASASTQVASASTQVASAREQATASPLGAAKIGAAAPEFELPDLDGKLVQLSSFRGKTIVLEWFNPGCPFVKASHTKGSLIDTAARHERKGVVWLAINSGAKGKQGHGAEANREAKQRFNMPHPVLLDESGAVGRAYAAAHTPHMYVIDKNGVLVYRGAIDNSPDGEGESPADGKLVNYIDAAIADIAAGKPVAVPQTEAYGCSVKYQM
jgi:peroxiredoxin